MKELITTKKYKKFIHKEGSKYELQDYDDDGLHINYLEINKELYGIGHKVLIKDREQWNELCKKYPF